VSADADIIRGRLLESVLHSQFEGLLYLVGRSQKNIGDLTCYASIDALPGPVDLSILTIPANYVNDAMLACAAKGVRAKAIISSGFAEKQGGQGLARQQQLRQVAEAHNMVLIGPNAEGFLNSFMPPIATFSPVLRKFFELLIPAHAKADAIAVTSQSGGIGFACFDRGRPRHLPFGYVASMGNEAREESLQVMNHMLDDARIGICLMFLEGSKTPAMFTAVASKAMSAGKPLVIAKMGRSSEGAAAAHTSSMASEFASYEAMMAHMGIASSDDLDDTLDIATAFAFFRKRRPCVAILLPSGSPGIWLTDACIGAGLAVPELDASTRKEFGALLPSYGRSHNPVNLTAQFSINSSYARGSKSRCPQATSTWCSSHLRWVASQPWSVMMSTCAQ
jgi:acyl-CoA synthetase (NDP forming)